jgi:exodeoxyribonuclease VII large subunit
VPRDDEIRSVDEVCEGARDLLESEFFNVWISGEVSQCTLHRASGHLYATLRGDRGILPFVMWRGTVRRLGLEVEVGQRLTVHGYLTIYEPSGKFQLIADNALVAGRGDLLRELEERKRRLADEGLFEAERKQRLPLYPRWIGVVTSLQAAALKDFVRIVYERYPARMLVAPAPVQGERAPAQLIQALRALDACEEVDVIVLTRGGGSVEDLAVFSDEALVRAVAACRTPVVSAVGHEVDTVLTDLAADLRAPTPTAAGALVVPKMEDLLERLEASSEALVARVDRLLAARRERLLLGERRLVHPGRRLDRMRLRLADLAQGLEAAARRQVALRTREHAGLADRLARRRPGPLVLARSRRLAALRRALVRPVSAKLRRLDERAWTAGAALEALDPSAVLARGYSITRRAEDGALVRSTSEVAEGTALETRVADGTLRSIVAPPRSRSRKAR